MKRIRLVRHHDARSGPALERTEGRDTTMALAPRPQVARKAKRALVDGARRSLLLLLPPSAKQVKSGISVWRRTPTSTKWCARAFVQWVPGRGTKARGLGSRPGAIHPTMRSRC
jgi:hypothetical protein